MHPISLTGKIPYKGARGIILRLMRDHAVNGVCRLSQEAISSLTGYSLSTVKYSIRSLESEREIVVRRGGDDRRNAYQVRP